MAAKILVLGATGAMGTYLVPELLEKGYAVDAVSLDEITADQAGLRYIAANAKDDAVRKKLLSNHYDAIVDFMVYRTEPFYNVHEEFLNATGQYIFLSSYRVFAESKRAVTETSPQLIDVSTDEEFLASDDYALRKCRGERILRASRRNNWTIVRPAITYSKKRCQLVTLEREEMLPCLRENRPVLLPEAAKNVQATMTWAGDVAKMIAALVLDGSALGEDFNVTTSEHQSWGQVAEIYAELFGLKYKYVGIEEYLDFRNRKGMPVVWQLHYDRLFNRVMDNTKILRQTGLKQQQLTKLYEGLKRERATILAQDGTAL